MSVLAKDVDRDRRRGFSKGLVRTAGILGLAWFGRHIYHWHKENKTEQAPLKDLENDPPLCEEEPCE